jgi:hypothetical protein
MKGFRAWRKVVVLIAAALASPAARAAGESSGEYWFEGIFTNYGSEAEAAAALAADPEGRETNLRYGNFYFILGTAATTPAGSKAAYLRKATDALEKLWKRNKRDNEVCLSLGYAYTGMAGCLPMSELEALLAAINKAQNLFGMVVARLPRNIDARLARTLINMNLTPQNGRPDALVLEDVEVFFAGYDRLPEDQKANPYYLMGVMEMRLAKALVYNDQGRRAETRELVRGIDVSVLPQHFRGLLDPLQKAYR